MGIDIYMRWDGMTEEDRDKQITGFDATKGDVGYLREASHGQIFATQYLVKEAFEEGADEVHIHAKELRKRFHLLRKLLSKEPKRFIKRN